MLLKRHWLPPAAASMELGSVTETCVRCAHWLPIRWQNGCEGLLLPG